MSLASMFKDLIRCQRERQAGKIQQYPNGYALGASGFTNRNGVHLKAREDSRGMLFSLTPKRSAGNCPLPPGPEFAVFEKGAFVPMAKCRKCEHHLPRCRKQPYACCALLRERDKGETPAKAIAEVFAGAAKTAKELGFVS